MPMKDILTYEEIRSVVEQAAELGFRHIRLSGGEDAMRHLKELQQSEGSPARIEKVVADFEAAADKELKAIDLKRVNLNVD